MKYYLPLTLLLAVSSLVAHAGDTKEELDKRAERATKTLNAIVHDQEIPRSVITSSDCVASITIHKGGFAGFGARTGTGLATCKTADGWSNPSVINVHGATFGPQIGIGKLKMVMMFVGEKSVNQLKKRNFSGDGAISLVAGPIGREATAGVDLKLNNGIYSYSKAKGLFFGATLGAVMISPDKSANAALYGKTEKYDISKILETSENDELPESFQTFLAELKNKE